MLHSDRHKKRPDDTIDLRDLYLASARFMAHEGRTPDTEDELLGLKVRRLNAKLQVGKSCGHDEACEEFNISASTVRLTTVRDFIQHAFSRSNERADAQTTGKDGILIHNARNALKKLQQKAAHKASCAAHLK